MLVLPVSTHFPPAGIELFHTANGPPSLKGVCEFSQTGYAALRFGLDFFFFLNNPPLKNRLFGLWRKKSSV